MSSSKEYVKKAICWWCKPKCFVNVRVTDDGRLVKVEEPPKKLCPRWPMAKEWFYHPQRLKYPLKRVGERGEDKWKEVSWGEALDEVAVKIREIKEKYGPESIAVSTGTCRSYEEFRYRFLNLIGSPNQIGQVSVCHGNSAVMGFAVLGWFPWWYPGDNLKLSKCIMLIGRNPPPAHQTIWIAIREAKEKGAKLIVIDPRRSQSASESDLWLQIRPGTDAAVLLSIINVIISEELYDKEFVAKWCYGFDKLAERVKEYTPQKVSEIAWVSPEKIIKAAEMFATNKPACAMEGMGVAQQPNAHAALQARYILTAITGNIDIPGGDELLGPNLQLITEHEMEMWDAIPKEQRLKQIGCDRFKLLSWPGYELVQSCVEKVWRKRGDIQSYTNVAHAPLLFRAIITGKPYPVKALITLSSNPMVTNANIKLVYRALRSLELYVVVDYFKTPSAVLADYIFPAASWLERATLYNFRTLSPDIKAAEAALPATQPGEYDRRTDYEFWRELAVRLGQDGHWPWKSIEEVYDFRIKPMGFSSFKEFLSKTNGLYIGPREYKKYEKKGFGTPTGKVELYSTILEKLGYDPLPAYEEPRESPYSSPELAKEYPFILINGARFFPYFHSEHRQIERLRKVFPWPIVEVNPDTAKRLCIVDGDWVWIENRLGRIMQKCRIFDGIHPQVVHAQHGWWYPELPGKEPYLHGVWVSNVNVLTDDDPDKCDKVEGTWPLRAFLCKIYKVEKDEWTPEKGFLPPPDEFKRLFSIAT
jgi:anaerobic selenocysteine-containing dehydrogenase